MKRPHKLVVSLIAVGLLAGCSRMSAPEGDASESLTVKTSTASFSQDVLQSESLVIVDFYADWCGPCRRVAPILEDLATEYEGRVKIVKLDIDANQKLAEEFDVRSIPTFFAFRDGKLLEAKTGAMGRGSFTAWFDGLLQRPS